MSFKVIEIFESINGEGMRAGELAVFVRMKGCNLSCNYCDTMWANKPDCEFAEMTAEQIVDRVKKSGIKNVTLTGGEPLLQKDADKLLEEFSSEKDIRVEIETNGSIDLKPFLKFENVSFTMDYKLPESDMEKGGHKKCSAVYATSNFISLYICNRKPLRDYLITSLTIFIGQVFFISIILYKIILILLRNRRLHTQPVHTNNLRFFFHISIISNCETLIILY